MAGAGDPDGNAHRRRQDDRRSGPAGCRGCCGLRGRLCARVSASQARFRRGPCGPLARRLLLLELRDRRVDRREEPLLLPELAVTSLLLRAPLPDSGLALPLQLLELPLPRLHGVLEAQRLFAERRVLVRERLRRLGPVDQLREAVRAGEHLDRARRPVHVERVEARHEPLLRGREIPLRHMQPVLVPPQAPLRHFELLLGAPRLILGELEPVPIASTWAITARSWACFSVDLRRRMRPRHGRSDSRRECGERACRGGRDRDVA